MRQSKGLLPAAGSNAGGPTDIAVVYRGGVLAVYPWESGTGFGTKYSNPATLPTSGNGIGVDFSPSGNDIAINTNVEPYIYVYRWTRGVGFGAKYADPSRPIPVSFYQGTGKCRFNTTGNDLAVMHYTLGGSTVYPFTSGTGFGTNYPEVNISPYGICVDWHPNGTEIAMGYSFINNPITSLRVFPFTHGTGMGTAYADPANPPLIYTSDVRFSPSGNDIVAGQIGSPYLYAYRWNTGTGFGTQYSNPSTPPTNGVNGVAFHPTGNDVAFGTSDSPYILAYRFTSGTGFGTKYSDPATLPNQDGYGVAFSPNGEDVAICHRRSPYISVYPWQSGTGFGVKYADPASPLTDTAAYVAFCPT